MLSRILSTKDVMSFTLMPLFFGIIAGVAAGKYVTAYPATVIVSGTLFAAWSGTMNWRHLHTTLPTAIAGFLLLFGSALGLALIASDSALPDEATWKLLFNGCLIGIAGYCYGVLTEASTDEE